jgi:hypothetical protein
MKKGPEHSLKVLDAVLAYIWATQGLKPFMTNTLYRSRTAAS